MILCIGYRIRSFLLLLVISNASNVICLTNMTWGQNGSWLFNTQLLRQLHVGFLHTIATQTAVDYVGAFGTGFTKSVLHMSQSFAKS